jgi:TonB family protein
MASRVDRWPESTGGGRRVVAALVVSLLCHALALALARGWRGDARPAAPLVVTMLERGRGSDDAAAGAAAAGAAPPSAARAAPPPLPARAARAEPRAKRAVPRRAPHAIAERVVADPAASASAAQSADTTGAAHGGTGTSAAGSGAGAGRGAGNGNGADGLRAFCADCPAPDYPSRARRQGWQGAVDVALAIGADGAVTVARVERSSGYPALDDVALDVARRSRFALPAGGAGLRGQLRYRFVLDATAARR